MDTVRVITTFKIADPSKSSWAFSGDLPSSGVHYVKLTIFFDNRPCCVGLGVVPTHTASMPTAVSPNTPWMVQIKGIGEGPKSAELFSSGVWPLDFLVQSPLESGACQHGGC
jgi:hypothetical protein